MGKLTHFYVGFNENTNGVYYPGQMISGSVVVSLNAPMKMRAIKLQFYGGANVHWTEQRSTGTGKDRRTTTDHYRASETYFNQQVHIYGQGSGGNTEHAKEIPVGQNVYPFQFQLPPNLPSSFEGVHGNVRYFIKASIDKPWKFNHNSKSAFTVLDTVDLNLDPNARLAVTSNGSKTLCCLCCASGPIQAQLHIDRSGYVPGELILVNASVDNASSSHMPSTSVSLIQQVTFRATTKSRTIPSTITTLTGPGCGAGKSIEWNQERLQIPPLPPSMLRFCNIIVINYLLQFTVVVPSGSINLKIAVPVQLGSIPLQGLTPYNIGPTTIGIEPSAPPTFEPPPPSYASVANGAVNIKDDDDNEHLMGQTTFTPQYAYYDWSQSAFTYTNN